MDARKPWLVTFAKGKAGAGASSQQVAKLKDLVQRQLGTLQASLIDPSPEEFKRELATLCRDNALHKGLAISVNGSSTPVITPKAFGDVVRANATKGYFTVFLYNADSEDVEDWRDELREIYNKRGPNTPQVTLNVNTI